MRQRLAPIVLAAAIIAVGAPTPAGASSGDEGRFVSLLNGERSSRGIARLPVAGELTAIARKHSERMAADGRIYHNSALPSQVGSGWKAIGENVGRGGSVESIHRAFMDSAGHRAHILDSRYNEVGVGVAVRDGTIYVTQVFVQRATVRRAAPRAERPARPSRARRPASPPPRVVVVAVEPPAAREVAVLLRLLAHDADVINPATGMAAGV